jgi:hypothetical protein
VLLFVAATAFASMAALSACSSDDATPAGADAGDESTGQRDAPYYVPPDVDPKCDPDADLTANVTDATILESGTTTGICVTCLHANCSAPIADCTADCNCNGRMTDAIGCYLTTQNIACLGRFADYLVTDQTRGRALAVAGCAKANCAAACDIDAGSMTIADAGDAGDGD